MQIIRGIGRLAAQSNDERLCVGSVVEYEQHGKPILGVLLRESKNKWCLVNESGSEVEMPAARLYLYPGTPSELSNGNLDRQRCKNWLQEQLGRLEVRSSQVSLEELWQTVCEEGRSFTIRELLELVGSAVEFELHLVLRRLLLADSVYFKRSKLGFEPRPAHVVEELKQKALHEEAQARRRRELVEAIERGLKGEEIELPKEIELLEDFAVFGSKAALAKQAEDLLLLVEQSGVARLVAFKGKKDEIARQLLVSLGRFGEHEDLKLRQLRRHKGFGSVGFGSLDSLLKKIDIDREISDGRRRDLRSLFTITIDSEDTLDIDDALSLEVTDRGVRLGIHITDVASFVDVTGDLFEQALERATTVYCPDYRIPMLPPELSEGALSLVQGQPRRALSYFVLVNDEGEVLEREICSSVIEVDLRLTYDRVDEILDSEGLAGDSRVDEILHQLWKVSSSLELKRTLRGAIQINRLEVLPVIVGDRWQVELKVNDEDSLARKIVGESMILANESAALLARDARVPLVFRGQEAPDVDIMEMAQDIPPGPAQDFARRGYLKRSVTSLRPLVHSGIGVEAYAHTTSPIRRVVDLINQHQLIFGACSGESVCREHIISEERLEQLVQLAEVGLSEARLLQKERERYWIYQYIKQRNIRELSGVVVRIDGLKPLVELSDLGIFATFRPKRPNGKGKGSMGWQGVYSLGEVLRLKLERVNPQEDDLVLSDL